MTLAGKTMRGVDRKKRLAGAASLGVIVSVLFSGCDPAAITTIKVTTVQRIDQGDHTSLHVTTPDRESVIEVVAHVAEAHGLKRSADDGPTTLIGYFRRYETNENGHARTIRIWVEVQRDHPNKLKIVVFEWLAFRHTPLGKKVLNDLRTELKTKFGPDVISSRGPNEAHCLPANLALQPTAGVLKYRDTAILMRARRG